MRVRGVGGRACPRGTPRTQERGGEGARAAAVAPLIGATAEFPEAVATKSLVLLAATDVAAMAAPPPEQGSDHDEKGEEQPEPAQVGPGEGRGS